MQPLKAVSYGKGITSNNMGYIYLHLISAALEILNDIEPLRSHGCLAVWVKKKNRGTRDYQNWYH
jgi:hypothetical protein